MNRILLIAAVLFFCLNVKSQQQQEYFVFIQETSRQPFYVRMGEASHSSSATGHIILSKLRDSVYNFFIGFPKGRSPEQLFNININKKDHGYELRNMDGRWQLFDLQTLQIISPATAQRADGQTVMRSDSYSELMANVVDDSAVLYSAVEDTLNTDTIIIAAEVKAAADSARRDSGTAKAKASNRPEKAVKDTVVEERQKEVQAKNAPVADTTTVVHTPDTVTVMRTTDTTAVLNTPPLQVPFIPQTSSGRDKRDIIRLITENIAEGKLVIYIDRSGPANDTIRIVIPRP